MEPIVRVSGLDKYFGHLQVLKKVSVDVAPREVNSIRFFRWLCQPG